MVGGWLQCWGTADFIENEKMNGDDGDCLWDVGD
jgi:hypothetical protein